MSAPAGGRVVFYGQWVAALLIPLFYIVGRVWIGAGAGWFVVLGVFLGPVMVALLLVPPILISTVPVRQARATPGGYTRFTWALWALGVCLIVTKSDQADGTPENSALSTWTGLPVTTTDLINAVVTVAFWITWVVVLGLAIRERVRHRRRSATVDRVG